MNFLRKVVTAVGSIVLAALLIAALAPRAARGVAAALVQVTNTPANPVPTTSADSAANFPFGAGLCLESSLNGCPTTFPLTIVVPHTTSTGLPVRRLAIDGVSAICDNPESLQILAEIDIPFPADSAPNGLPSERLMFPVTTEITGAVPFTPMQAYADPGATISGGIKGQVSSDQICLFTLVGHLETH